ncbi:MAG: leucine-rich repeat protein [Arcanobacterium sp.]|nr:leucine-rich repeat protein [Arcanobacterium sp.]
MKARKDMHVSRASILFALVFALVAGVLLPAPPATAALSDFTIADGVITAWAPPAGFSGTLEIPAADAAGKPVTGIANRVFVDKQEIKAVAFPDSLTTIGKEAFARTKIDGELDLKNVTKVGDSAFDAAVIDSVKGAALQTIGVAAFRGNEIAQISLPSTLTEIGEHAFSTNRLQSVVIPESVQKVGAKAFENNALEKVDLQAAQAQVAADAFYNNAEWVAISTQNQNVITSAQGGSRVVVNPVKVTYQYAVSHYINLANQTQLKPDDNVGDVPPLLSAGENVIRIPAFVDTTVKQVQVDGTNIGIGDGTTVKATLKAGSTVKFVYYTEDKKPRITGVKARTYPYGTTVTAEMLLEGVSAISWDRKENLTADITVSPIEIKDASENSVVTVIYTVKDKAGNIATRTAGVLIGTDWASVPTGGGWVVGDFTFKERRVSGLSESGKQKLASGNTVLAFPSFDTEGNQVYAVGGLDPYMFRTFYTGEGKITGISSWGDSITEISESAFTGANSLTTLPKTWGKIRTIGSGAFSGTQLTELPEKWGSVTSLGSGHHRYSRSPDGAFQGITTLKKIPDDWGNITKIPDNTFREDTALQQIPVTWGNVTEIGKSAFYDCDLQAIPDSWGDVTTIGGQYIADDYPYGQHANYYQVGTFAKNNLRTIPGSWGKITRITNRAFKDNQISELPGSWGKVTAIDNAAFSANKISALPESFGLVTQLGEEAFYANKITHITDWTNVETLGDSVFQWNNLTSLPNQWEKITVIPKDAFKENKLTVLPKSWDLVGRIDESAFNNNSLVEIPNSWGSVKSIGNRAFEDNRLTAIPNDFAEVESIGERAFSGGLYSGYPGNRIATPITSWGKVTKIEKGAFRFNEISEIPADWAGITTIDESALEGNRLTKIPQSWGKVTSINNRAFSANKIETIPDSWGDVATVGYSAFSNNQIAKIPVDWGKITEIPNDLFKMNKITAIPSWSSVTKLGHGAFYYNPITSIPDTWGKLTIIGSQNFAGKDDKGAPTGAHLSKIPDSWGEATLIGDRAFYGTGLTEVPDSWGKVTYIGGYAFANNELTKLPDSWSDVKTINSQNVGYAFANNKLRYVPPLADIEIKEKWNAFKNNIPTVTVTYKNELGENVAPPLVVEKPSGIDNFSSSSLLTTKDRRYTPLRIPGYVTPADQLPTQDPDGKMHIDYVYKQASIETDQTVRLDFKKFSPTVNFVGKPMLTQLFVDKSGAPAVPAGSSLHMIYDPTVYAKPSVGITQQLQRYIDHVDYSVPGSVRIVLKEIPGATNFSVPIDWRFRPNMEQIGTNYPIQAFLIKPDGKTQVNEAVNTEFSPVYSGLDLKVNSYISDGGVFVNADSGDTTITYFLGVKGPNERAVGAYEVRVPVPTPPNGKGGVAEAKIMNSSGWVREGNEFVYRNTETAATSGIPSGIPPLVVKYTDLKAYEPVKFSPKITATPRVQGPNEPLLTDSSYTSDQATKYEEPELLNYNFIKRSLTGSSVNKYDTSVYDLRKVRQAGFDWLISGHATYPVTSVEINDSKLDPRLYYSGVVSWRKNLDGAILTTFDKAGKVLGTYRLDPVKAADGVLQRGPINFSAATFIDRITIRKDSGALPGGEYTLLLHTDVRNVADPLLTQRPDGIIAVDHMPNTATIDFTSASTEPYHHERTANVLVQPLSEQVQVHINKTVHTSADDVIQDLTKPQETYMVSVSAPTGNDGVFRWQEQPLKDATVVATLPKGFNLSRVIPSAEFLQAGGRYKASAQADGTTLVTFTAPYLESIGKTLPIAALAGEYTYEVAPGQSGDYLAEAYLTDTNSAVKEINTPSSTQTLPPGMNDIHTTSYALAKTTFNLGAVFAAVKDIRNVLPGGEFGPWARDIVAPLGGTIEYRLMIMNYTADDRTGTVFLDKLPMLGDTMVDTNEAGEKTNRGTQFRPTPNYIVVPSGYTAYTCAMKPDDVVNQGSVGADAGTCSTTPLVPDTQGKVTIPNSTTGLKIVANEGVVLKAGTAVEILVGSTVSKDPRDVDKVAINSFVRKDDGQAKYLEANPVSVKMAPPQGTVTLTKHNEKGEPQAGARFSLTGMLDMAAGLIDPQTYYAVSGADGVVTFTGIDARYRYVLKEEAAPQGYDVATVTCGGSSSQCTVTFTQGVPSPAWNLNTPVVNKPTPPPPFGNLEFRKVDGLGAPIAGVTFTLTNLNTSPVTVLTATSDKDGIVRFFDVPLSFKAGNLQRLLLKEQPFGHLVPIADRWITIHPGETLKLSEPVANPQAKIHLTKIGFRDANKLKNKPITGFAATDGVNLDAEGIHATFVLKKFDAHGVQVGADMTVQSGTDVNLDTGFTYSLKETAITKTWKEWDPKAKKTVEKTAPLDIYPIEDREYKFTVAGDGTLHGLDAQNYVLDSSQIVFPNLEERRDSTAQVHKKDQDGTVVKGAQFELILKGATPAEDKVIETKSTDDQGLVQFTGLQGAYTIREKAPALGYLPNPDATWTFTADPFAPKDFAFSATNTAQKARIMKVDRLFDGIKDQATAQRIADAHNGQLPEGEVKAQVTLLLNGTYAVDKPLANAQFEIKDAQGGVVETVISGADGIAPLTKLLQHDATYTVTELAAPDGYRKLAKPITFTPDSAALSAVDHTVLITVPNNRIAGRISLVKYQSGTSIVLPEAEFQITDEAGQPVKDIDGKQLGNKTTDANGTIFWDRLPIGTADAPKVYLVKEVRAPDGYVLTDESKAGFTARLTQTDGQMVASFAAFNPKKTVNFRLHKVDKDGRALEGAAFTLRGTGESEFAATLGADGTVTVTSNKALGDGGVQPGAPVATDSWNIPELPAGHYVLTETRSPEGYSLLPEPIEFDVVVDNPATADIDESAVTITRALGKAEVTKDSDGARVYSLSVANYKQGDLPKAGHGGLFGIMSAGIMSLLFAGALIVARRGKRS